ncbi:MAG: hypothetical protein K0S12_1325 [Bacteroidetes bacterium]|nr:hypothetical protein [Bacteroidota bacterium]
MKNFFLINFFLLFFCSYGQNLDFRIVRDLNKPEMPVWDKTMKGVSFSVIPVMPAVVGGVWCHGYFTKDEALMRSGFKSAIAITFAAATSTGLKYLVNRKRPFAAYPADIVQRDSHVGPFSFPSGHTTTAFASATALSLSYKKWYVTLPAYVYAGFVAYSRMRLGVHYPTDLLGGMVIGIGAGLLTWQLDKTINGK